MLRLQATLSGRVQGVGFRAFVLHQALDLGLTGTVRNIYFPSRRVEVVAEGPEAALRQLLDQISAGPSMASVANITVTWEQASGGFPDFSIT